MTVPVSLASLLTAPDRMRGVFQRELEPFDTGRWEIQRCEVRQARRRISRRTESGDMPYLDVCYWLEVLDRETGNSADRWLYAKAYHRQASAMAYARARIGASERTPWGAPVAHLPSLDLVLWNLPNDPVMAHLGIFLDPHRVSWQLSATSGEPRARTEVRAVQICRLEPEEHCTARFELDEHGAWPTLFGKTYGDERWRLAWRVMNYLYAQGETDENAFALPRPVAASEVLKAYWQEASPGEPIEHHMHDPVTVRRIGRALAVMHRGGPQTERTITPTDLLDQARKWRKKMVQACAIEPVTFDSLLAQLQVTAPPERQHPIHGDFHVRQMLRMPDGRVHLFDYDGFSSGSPAFDVAHFVSQWMTTGPLDGADPKPAMEFVRAWRAAWGTSIDDAELDWYLRVMFLRKAYSFFVHQGPDWVERADLAVAHAQLGLSGVGNLQVPAR